MYQICPLRDLFEFVDGYLCIDDVSLARNGSVLGKLLDVFQGNFELG